MGNASSSKRDRASSSDVDCPSSPCKDDKVFEFGSSSRSRRMLFQALDENVDVFKDKNKEMRARASTVTGRKINEAKFPSVFKWDGGGKEVLISGTFSNWKPIPMVKSHGDFALILDIPEGVHEYKFQVDGQWIHAPNQPSKDNNMGTKNNIVSVQKSDFEVFEALAVDSINSSNGASASYTSSPGSFSQEIPPRCPYEKSVGPPILPPHLLEVILNKDVSLSSEPILLPEPNHVMLNHLYALSIKDGVMVLSATLRYKKKYVTTLLYKPI